MSKNRAACGRNAWLVLLASIVLIATWSALPKRAEAACAVPNALSNGQVADASQVMANFNALVACVNAPVTAIGTAPQGRLTLTSNAPVMTADAVGQTTIYYAPYLGNQLPIAGVTYQFPQLSFALGISTHLAGNLYDMFGYLASSSVALCTSPAWTNSTTRAAAIGMVNGIWTNSASLTCTVSGGSTAVSLPAGQATYLGTFYATGNGQTGMQSYPACAAGANAAMLGLWNAYNRVHVVSRTCDSRGSWTYNTNSSRMCDNSAGNRNNWVDGLGQSWVKAKLLMVAGTAGNGFNMWWWNSVDVTSGGNFDVAATMSAPNNYGNNEWTSSGFSSTYPQMGFHFYQCIEQNNGGGSYQMNYPGNFVNEIDLDM